MLNSSFLHIPKIGAKTEQRLWESGIRTNEDFVNLSPAFIPEKTKEKIIDHIKKSKTKTKNPRHYYDGLPSSEQWRIFKRFKKQTVYIDIETTGLDFYLDKITTIALYDGESIKHYVNGINLDAFKKDISKYKVIVTYNGKTFDIPFIERFFKIKIKHCHLDLRYILNSLGYFGGLKSCEKQLGIRRKDGLEDVDGFMAVQIWDYYKQKKNKKALETLLSYNIEDVLNLEYLMFTAYNIKIESLPIQLDKLDIPPKKENPFKVDPTIVKKYQKEIPIVPGKLYPKSEIVNILDGYWEWLRNKNHSTYEISGKYLFFSKDRKLLIQIAKEELINGNFHLAKTHDEKVDPPSGEYVLCLYDKDDHRKYELAKKYKGHPRLKYRYWKSNEDTRKGKYSKNFLKSLL